MSTLQYSRAEPKTETMRRHAFGLFFTLSVATLKASRSDSRMVGGFGGFGGFGLEVMVPIVYIPRQGCYLVILIQISYSVRSDNNFCAIDSATWYLIR